MINNCNIGAFTLRFDTERNGTDQSGSEHFDLLPTASLEIHFHFLQRSFCKCCVVLVAACAEVKAQATNIKAS